MMSAPDRLTLQTRVDGFSYQVSAAEDERFWFRLERDDGRDVITDFFLGSCPRSSAGRLLADCYHALAITPEPVIVFGNIVPPDAADRGAALEQARAFYAACGEALLAGHGARLVDARLEVRRGKYNLVLEAVRDVPAARGAFGRN